MCHAVVNPRFGMCVCSSHHGLSVLLVLSQAVLLPPASWSLLGYYYPPKKQYLVENPLLLYGSIIIVLGLIFSSVGGACTHDRLLGFTNCNRRGSHAAFYLTFVGACMR